MNIKYITLTIVVAILMLLAGYNAGMMLGPETTATYTVAKIIDAMNRDVVITKPPERVVSLAPSVTEILFALGLGDKVVGVTSFCNYPPQVVNMTKEGKIEIVGGYPRFKCRESNST
uniref:Fe/B12 periplasmic-binding domain-containing protein n=1 Tax=Ignisphaera aggregans TaxID=334771 RepID=A0A7C2ZQ36_9CREN